MRTTSLTALCLALLALPLGGCDRGSDPRRTFRNRRRRIPRSGRAGSTRASAKVNGRKVIVYAPQIRSWDEFKHFTAQMAVEFLAEDASARYAVIDLSGETTVDREARIVKVPKPKVDRVTFSGGKGSDEHENRIRTVVESEPLEIPLDVFLYYLADGVLESPPPAGFNDAAPPIYVVESPAFLLFINGEPFATAVGDSGLEVISNANFPVFRDKKTGNYYLLSGDHRYMSAKLAGPWGTIAELPPAFGKIPARGEFASIAAVVATRAEGRRSAGRHHDFQAGGDRRARRQAAGPRDSGHRRARIHREHGEPAVPARRHVLPAGRGPLVLDERPRARAVEIHDAIAGCVCAHPGRR